MKNESGDSNTGGAFGGSRLGLVELVPRVDVVFMMFIFMFVSAFLASSFFLVISFVLCLLNYDVINYNL